MKFSRFVFPMLGSVVVAAPAMAQPASATAPATPAATASTTTDTAPVPAGPVVAAATPEPAAYMTRYKPEAGLFEIGLMGGAFFPSSNLGLEKDASRHQPFTSPGFELGLRLAYFPLDFLGIEVEGAHVATSVKNGEGAGIWPARGHLIGQLTSSSIVPFLVVGAGSLGGNSVEMGGRANFGFHFGAGVKLPFDDVLSARLDLRDTMSSATSSSSASIAHSPEILLGLTITLDRKKPEAPPPPDADKDGVIDAQDKCPQQVGVPPDGCPPDGDQDGIPDATDSCPTQAGPAPQGCPPPSDTDGDGVMDPVDECPSVAGTMKNGCPDPDPDGDGISGEQDKCPTQPETKNGFQDDDGCPDELPEAVKRFSGAMPGIEFEFGQATIRATSNAVLDKAADTLKEYPDLKISIKGHTDNIGAHDRNVELSQKRAEAVKAYLVKKGIDASRIQASGAGPDEPLSTENTPLARSKNRRIEFKIVQ